MDLNQPTAADAPVALDLLLQLNRRGIRIYLRGNELRYQARTGAMTPELLEQLRLHKPQLERLLTSVGYDANCLIPIQVGRPGRVPLFCPHTIHGGVFDYRALAEGLDKDQPVYAFQALSFICGEEIRTSVAEMATYYARQLERVWPEGPVLLYGASAGGLIALEMAHKLSESGRTIGFVAMGDTIHPHFYRSLPEATYDQIQWVSFVESFLPNEVLEMSRAEHPFWNLDKQQRIDFLVKATAASKETGRLGRVDHAMVTSYRDAFLKYKSAFYEYELRPFDHRLIFFRADPPKPERYEEMIKLCTAQATVVPMQCNHIQMIRPPGVFRLARMLQGYIDEVAATWTANTPPARMAQQPC